MCRGFGRDSSNEYADGECANPLSIVFRRPDTLSLGELRARSADTPRIHVVQFPHNHTLRMMEAGQERRTSGCSNRCAPTVSSTPSSTLPERRTEKVDIRKYQCPGDGYLLRGQQLGRGSPPGRAPIRAQPGDARASRQRLEPSPRRRTISGAGALVGSDTRVPLLRGVAMQQLEIAVGGAPDAELRPAHAQPFRTSRLIQDRRDRSRHGGGLADSTSLPYSPPRICRAARTIRAHYRATAGERLGNHC